MFWHAWLAFHQQRHPYVSWHLCGPRALHNRIWEHKSSTILFSSVQYNSTDRVRCHPWSALIFWNAKTKQYAWPPSTFPMDPAPFVFHHIPENYHTHPAEPLDSLFFLAKMAWNAIVCETTGVSGGNSIFPIFQNTWFQTILAKKNEKKTLKTFHSPSTKILWNAQILPSVMIWQYEYLPSCGVRCPRWSAKKLWNAKNSEYAWLVYRPRREISGPESKFQSQSQPKLPGAHQWVLFFRVHFGLGEAPGKKLANFYSASL